MPIRVPTEDGIQELLKLVDLLPPPETNAGKMNVVPFYLFHPLAQQRGCCACCRH